MKQFIMILALLCQILSVNGQEQPLPVKSPSNKNIGLGIGLDYGGFGGRLTFLPTERLAVFAALGYNLIGLGFNGGAYYRISPQKKICPFIGAMYGYNGSIKVTGNISFKKAYYGPSFAIGTELWSWMKSGYFNLELILPIRSSEYHSDYDGFIDQGVEFKVPSIPVAFSLGYHFAF